MTPIDFPPNCPHCGWQLHPPAAWLAIRAWSKDIAPARVLWTPDGDL